MKALQSAGHSAQPLQACRDAAGLVPALPAPSAESRDAGSIPLRHHRDAAATPRLTVLPRDAALAPRLQNPPRRIAGV